MSREEKSSCTTNSKSRLGHRQGHGQQILAPAAWHSQQGAPVALKTNQTEVRLAQLNNEFIMSQLQAIW